MAVNPESTFFLSLTSLFFLCVILSSLFFFLSLSFSKWLFLFILLTYAHFLSLYHVISLFTLSFIPFHFSIFIFSESLLPTTTISLFFHSFSTLIPHHSLSLVLFCKYTNLTRTTFKHSLFSLQCEYIDKYLRFFWYFLWMAKGQVFVRAY